MTWAQEAVWCKYQPEYRVTSKYVFSRNFPADCGRWQLSCSWWGSGHCGHWCHVFSYWYCISLGIINKCYTVYYEGSLFWQGPGACVGCISAHYPWEGWKSMSHEVYWVSLWGECVVLSVETNCDRWLRLGSCSRHQHYLLSTIYYLQCCCVQQERGVQINLIVSHLILYLLWISLIRPWI